MTATKKQTTFLKDYRPPAFFVENVSLHFQLEENECYVTARLDFSRNSKNPVADLQLDGEELQLLSVRLNGREIDKNQYILSDDKLLIKSVPDKFSLHTQVKISPRGNTQLSGLYQSGETLCTQCEAQGFRRISYFLDRPDVMAVYTTTIEADKTRFPVLLSNGNPIAAGDLDNNRHYVTWQDPFKKPCYLFALVAGDLDLLEDQYTTCSGRKVDLRIYVERGQREKARFAMYAVKQAMRWDEQTFGREYDLDIYMIVAVSDFNMGAMENKGLNIFNAKYILADAHIATDTDFERILEVVGHEYFHNWTGNRITCRDWFQLSLKEGLTIFRDQEFTADMTSRAVKRIADARTLRTFQYAEDAGPMAHPVQPDSYIQIDNFYTHTVYEKGAEVIRMMQTLLGKEKFLRGMDLYFQRHDGEAVTIEAFVQAMEDAGHVDFSQFRRWYTQAGTPVLRLRTEYDVDRRLYKLSVTQHTPATPGQPDKEALHIPLKVALLSSEGGVLKDTTLLELKTTEETFVFHDISEQPVLSVLRDFSAPVKIVMDYRDEELAMLMAKDGNAFARWEALQQYLNRLFLTVVTDLQADRKPKLPDFCVAAFKNMLENGDDDQALLAELLLFPTEKYLMECLNPIDVKNAHRAFTFIQQAIARALYDTFMRLYQRNRDSGAYKTDYAAIARRKLTNACLAYLTRTEEPEALDLCLRHYRQANNMTDRIAAFAAILNSRHAQRDALIADFYQSYAEEPLALDKWFAMQAAADHPDVFRQVKNLTEHPAFNRQNPNRVRSLLGMFSMHNPYYFHQSNGEPYQLLADFILDLNQKNPQLAARLLEPLIYWKQFAEPQKTRMQEILQQISRAVLSSDVYEIVEKSSY